MNARAVFPGLLANITRLFIGPLCVGLVALANWFGLFNRVPGGGGKRETVPNTATLPPPELLLREDGQP